MKNYFLSSLTALAIGFGSLSAHAGGDFVNNGGGLAEKNILYAYLQIGTYIEMCLKMTSCKLDDRQRGILTQIYNGLPQEKKNTQQIIFDSETKHPGTFIIDGLLKVAKTGSVPGSPIYINVDLLYSKDELGMDQAVTLEESVAILVHEFGHHYGTYTCPELDLLGVRTSMAMQQRMTTTPLIPWTSEISASVINHNFLNSFPEVLLTVGGDIINISDVYQQSVQCIGLTIPIPVIPLPDVGLDKKKPLGSLFDNVHWDKLKENATSMNVRIVGNVSNQCKDKTNALVRDNDYKLSINFTIQKVNDHWVYDPKTLTMNQFKDPWWKILRLPDLE